MRKALLAVALAAALASGSALAQGVTVTVKGRGDMSPQERRTFDAGMRRQQEQQARANACSQLRFGAMEATNLKGYRFTYEDTYGRLTSEAHSTQYLLVGGLGDPSAILGKVAWGAYHWQKKGSYPDYVYKRCLLPGAFSLFG